MSEKVKAFLFGATHAFTPGNYSNMYQLGEVSKRIDRKTEANRREIRGKIETIKAQSNQSKLFEPAY